MRTGRTGWIALLLAACLAWGVPDATARAWQVESAPPPAPHGSSLAAPGATGVRLAEQDVLIEAQRNALGQAPYARVTAEFHLVNDGEQPEALALRYPLSAVSHAGGRQVCDLSPFLPLQEFQAWVDARPVRARVVRAPAESALWPSPQPPPERVHDCWALFDLELPPGGEARVRLQFRQEAGIAGLPGYALYPFALQTGAGWSGPVDSTRVTFRAPWLLTDENFHGHAFPSARLAAGLRVQTHEREIVWTFSAFEPDERADIVVGTMNPAVYSAINRGRLLYPGSRNADTWGRYALAAKQVVLSAGGLRADEIGERLYNESYDAYTRVLELVPWSAAWQAGFAELLCANAASPTFDLEWSELERWQACARRIKAALDLNPDQPLALRLLEQYADGRYLALDGRPAYPALSLTPPPRGATTPMPTLPAALTATAQQQVTPSPTATRRPSATAALVASATFNATTAAQAGTPENPPSATQPAAETGAPDPRTAFQTALPAALLAAVLALPIVALLALLARRFRS